MDTVLSTFTAGGKNVFYHQPPKENLIFDAKQDSIPHPFPARPPRMVRNLNALLSSSTGLLCNGVDNHVIQKLYSSIPQCRSTRQQNSPCRAVQVPQLNLNPHNLKPKILNYNQQTKVPLEKQQSVRSLHFVIHQNGSACRFSLKLCLASRAVLRAGPGFLRHQWVAKFRFCGGIWRLSGHRRNKGLWVQFRRYQRLLGATCWSFRVRSAWGVSSLS